MIKIFPSGPLDTNVYLFIDESTQLACLIDPAPSSFEKVFQWCAENKVTIKAMCITHSHWDHIGDIHLFLDEFPALFIFAHPLDQDNLIKPGFDGIDAMVSSKPILKSRIQSYPMPFEIGASTFQVIHTPGHSPGCVCLFEPTKKVLFSGDTLFHGTYGLTSLPTSSRRDMFLSLQRLATLPEETIVYPGHGRPTTIGKEKPWMERVTTAQLKY